MERLTLATVISELAYTWITPAELADRYGCTTRRAEQQIKAVSQWQIVFRRQRKAAFKRPYEYRILPEAIQIQSA